MNATNTDLIASSSMRTFSDVCLDDEGEKTWRYLIACCVLSFAFLAPAVAAAEVGYGNNAVGANAHVATTAYADGVADMGAGWIRLDGNWWTLQPSPNDYDWGPLDDAVAAANEAELNILITFAYTPSWVPATGTDDNHLSDVPNSSVEWVDFMEDAVTRYRAMGVRHYGMWNEPNLDNFFNGTAHDYVNTILIPGAAAVRNVCDDCYVVGPHLSSHDRNVDHYLRIVLDEVGGDFFDIISHHAFRGFEETGSNPWDRKFVNSLDIPCDFPFLECADPLREVLDEYDYDGEVWVTETGDRATPGDEEEEGRQATYATRVLEEQAERPWYTNTFFYEIHDCGPDQPECGIDGFGLTRATGGQRGSRTFPDDFRLKPAFYAIRQFVDDNPGFSHEPTSWIPEPEEEEPVESEPEDTVLPTPREVSALHTRSMGLTADMTGFGDAKRIHLDASNWVGLGDVGADNTTVEAALRWNADNLYIGVEVEQMEHHNHYSAEELWRGDSLQIAFDTGNVGGEGYDAVNHHEMGFALSNSETMGTRFHGPAAATDDWEALVDRVGTTTTYEIHLKPAALGLSQFDSDQVMGFGLLVNIADAAGRLGWLELTPGIGESKSPEQFAQLHLSTESGGSTSAENGQGSQAHDGAGQPISESANGHSSDTAPQSAESSSDSQDSSEYDDTDSNVAMTSACTASAATPTGDGLMIMMVLFLLGALRFRSKTQPEMGVNGEGIG